MNDAERRRSPDGFDDDAIFADIIAHLNDEATEPGQTDRPGAADEASEDNPTDQPGERTGPESTRPRPGDRHGAGASADPGHWSVNPPPWPMAPRDQATVAPGPDEPVPEEPAPGGPGPDESTPGSSSPVEPPADPTAQVWRGHQVDDEDEEHFEPPPVSPLPAGDLQFWAIIAGMTAGPLLLLYLVFFNRYASSFWILAAIGMSVGGFALLVSRMPGHDDDDDGARL